IAFIHVRGMDGRQPEFGTAARQFLPSRRLRQLDGLARVTLVFLPANGSWGLSARRNTANDSSIWGMAEIYSFTKAFDSRKLLDAMVPGAHQETYRGKTVNVSNSPSPCAMHLVNDRVFVTATDIALLRPILRQSIRPQREGALATGLEMAGKHDCTA